MENYYRGEVNKFAEQKILAGVRSRTFFNLDSVLIFLSLVDALIVNLPQLTDEKLTILSISFLTRYSTFESRP